MGKLSQSYLKELAEKKKYKSGGFSTEGYKRNSPDVNNPYNVIPSNQITMEGVDFPVMGIDDMGHQQMMYPGNNYTFPGNYVTEFPVKNMGNKRYGQVGFQNRGEISTEDSPIELPYVEIKAKRNPLAGVKPLKREPGARSPLAKNAQPQDQLRTQYYRKPEEQMAGISETKKEDLRRKISGVLRETTQADKDWAAEQANRKALTFSGASDGSVLGGMLDLVNPFSYYYAGKDAVRGAGETAQAIYEGNPDAVAAGLFKTGLNALQLYPGVSAAKSVIKGAAPRMFRSAFVNEADDFLRGARSVDDFSTGQPFNYGTQTGLNAGSKIKAVNVSQTSTPITYLGVEASEIPQKVDQLVGPILESGVKSIYNTLVGLKNSPTLNYFMEYGRFPKSMSGIRTSPGVTQSMITNPKIPFQQQIANTNKFLQGLERGAASLDESVTKRIKDLESPEGFNRLVAQEKEYLQSIGYQGSLESTAKVNAKARIEELRNYKNINKEAGKYREENFIIPENEFVKDKYLFSNAYYSFPESVILDTYNPNFNPNFNPNRAMDFTLKNLSKYPQLGAQALPGDIGMGYNFIKNKPIEMHEIAHALQRGRRMPFDTEIKYAISPKLKLKPLESQDYDYFMKGSTGKEPSAFLNELRESMLQKGFIPDYYTEIKPQQVEAAYNYFRKNPVGIFSPKENLGKKFLSNTRIFDFMAPTQTNYDEIARLLNKAPVIVGGIGGGLGALQQYLQNQKPKGTYQMGGTMGIPGVNGQVVSSGPQPLTSVKKTRGPITKTKKGDVKTMSNKQVKKILKNIK